MKIRYSINHCEPRELVVPSGWPPEVWARAALLLCKSVTYIAVGGRVIKAIPERKTSPVCRGGGRHRANDCSHVRSSVRVEFSGVENVRDPWGRWV